jgi:hypothetical protein
MNDPDGLALMIWVLLAIGVLLAAAGSVEWLLSRPSRRWIRKLRELERARLDWSARVIAGQCFWKQEK